MITSRAALIHGLAQDAFVIPLAVLLADQVFAVLAPPPFRDTSGEGHRIYFPGAVLALVYAAALAGLSNWCVVAE